MDVFPDFEGLGGVGDLQEVVGAALMIALIVAVLMLIVSGIIWAIATATGNYQAAAKALKACWGDTPLYTYEGGTMPVTSTLEKTLQAPALLLPMGQSTDNPHLANERIRSINLFQGKNVMRALMEEGRSRRATMNIIQKYV